MKKKIPLTFQGTIRIIYQIKKALNSSRITGWEMSFLDNIHKRILKYSNRVLLSEKEWNRLIIIFENTNTPSLELTDKQILQKFHKLFLKFEKGNIIVQPNKKNLTFFNL